MKIKNVFNKYQLLNYICRSSKKYIFHITNVPSNAIKHLAVHNL